MIMILSQVCKLDVSLQRVFEEFISQTIKSLRTQFNVYGDTSRITAHNFPFHCFLAETLSYRYSFLILA